MNALSKFGGLQSVGDLELEVRLSSQVWQSSFLRTRTSDDSSLQPSKGEEALERIYDIKHNTEFRARIHVSSNTSI